MMHREFSSHPYSPTVYGCIAVDAATQAYGVVTDGESHNVVELANDATRAIDRRVMRHLLANNTTAIGVCTAETYRAMKGMPGMARRQCLVLGSETMWMVGYDGGKETTREIPYAGDRASHIIMEAFAASVQAGRDIFVLGGRHAYLPFKDYIHRMYVSRLHGDSPGSIIPADLRGKCHLRTFDYLRETYGKKSYETLIHTPHYNLTVYTKED